MKRIFISMVLLISMVTVNAQTETKTQNATLTETENDELTTEINRAIELSNVTANFGSIMVTQLQPLVEQGLLSAENLPTMVKEIEEWILPNLKKRMVTLYKEHFTLDELKQMNAYLASPVGQKALKLTPEFAAEGMAIVQTPEAQQKIQEIFLHYMKK